MCLSPRLLSSKPNDKYWPRGISAEDISFLFAVDGEYGRLIATRFESNNLKGKFYLSAANDIEITVNSARLAYKLLK